MTIKSIGWVAALAMFMAACGGSATSGATSPATPVIDQEPNDGSESEADDLDDGGHDDLEGDDEHDDEDLDESEEDESDEDESEEDESDEDGMDDADVE